MLLEKKGVLVTSICIFSFSVFKSLKVVRMLNILVRYYFFTKQFFAFNPLPHNPDF